jgi:cyclophilin family peptidyl-prolyl cis-trans isomerase
LLISACSSSTAGSASGSGNASDGVSGSAPATVVNGSKGCQFTATPSDPAPSGKAVGVPPAAAPATGAATVTLHTSDGDIPLTLNRTAAPCTVASFVFLTSKKYFDNTPCHRLTSYADPTPLKVLQCGDPTGLGTGGPGYTIPDENPTGLKAAPAGSNGASVYPRGSVAMANTGQPNSGGSQFFLVYGDSYLPPQYSLFGTVGAAGLATLDKIAAGGITPGTDSSGTSDPNDGAPKLKVTITQAVSG